MHSRVCVCATVCTSMVSPRSVLALMCLLDCVCATGVRALLSVVVNPPYKLFHVVLVAPPLIALVLLMNLGQFDEPRKEDGKEAAERRRGTQREGGSKED